MKQFSFFSEFVQASKISVYSIHSLRYRQFQSPVTRLATHIFYLAYTKNFKFQQFWFIIQKIRLFHWFIIWVDLKILQSNWLRAFWPISWEMAFSQIWDLCRNTANNISFHYKTNSVKIIGNFFSKFKTLSLTHFSNFWGKKSFSKNSGSVTYNFIWEWSNSTKTSRQTEGQMEVWTNEWTDLITEQQTDPI